MSGTNVVVGWINTIGGVQPSLNPFDDVRGPDAAVLSQNSVVSYLVNDKAPLILIVSKRIDDSPIDIRGYRWEGYKGQDSEKKQTRNHAEPRIGRSHFCLANPKYLNAGTENNELILD
jgi:hypothetical protein